MISKLSGLRSLRAADPLRGLEIIALIELNKAVAKPLHFFAIADFMSAAAGGHFKVFNVERQQADGLEWSCAGGGRG